MCSARHLSLIPIGLLVGCAIDPEPLGGSSGALAGDPSLPVEARLLVMSADGSETELTAIRTVLDYRGVPYDVFVAASEPALTASRLGSAAHGAYQGIIFTSSSVDSVLSASERTVLADYEATFAIRRAVLAAWPDPALGFGSYTTVNASTTRVTVRCTSAGREVFRDVNCDEDQRLDGDTAYVTSVASSALEPLLTDGSGRPLAVIHTGDDDRETLLLLYRNNVSRMHTHQFLHGVIGWVTGGTYLGERRIDLGAQLDDMFFGYSHYRLTDADLRAAVAWMHERPGFRVALAFNGEGAEDGDPLTEYARRHSAEFYWINHGWSHHTLDFSDYETAYSELQLNIDFAADFPLENFDVRNLVTGNYAGLVNREVMQAASDVGIRYAAMDTSKDGCANPSPNTTFYNRLAPSILFVPRRPTNLFWNVSEVDVWVDGYNARFGTDYDYEELLDVESGRLLRYLMYGEADPWMFHQGNLRAYDGTHSLMGDLIDATLAKLEARLDVPVRTPPPEDTGARFARRMNYEGAGVRATVYRGRALVIDAGRAVSVPVTGVRPGDGEAYGGDEIALVDVAPGASTCVPLDEDGEGCIPSPGREGGPGSVTSLPTGYCDGTGDVGVPPDDDGGGGDGIAVIARGSDWRYWDRGADLGTAWRARTYADASWAHGAGPLGYGESYIRTTVSYGSSSSNKHVTTYFRRSFDVSDASAITALRGEVMYDDGFVVYLNGTEIARSAMPSGTISYTTLSTGHEASNAYVDLDWSAHRGLLVDGSNTIAVELHQAGRTSSDLVFDLALSVEGDGGEPPPPEPPPVHEGGIPRGAAWWYWDNGGDLGASWRTSAGGSGWDSGRGAFGYGESYLATTVSYGASATNKHVTTYFTTRFSIDDPSEVTSILGEVMYDDGFVAYLNGVELGRAAMPAGTISASTLSSGHEAGNQHQAFDWSARRDLLIAGENVVAVEVHQASRDSSDLVFDLALTLDTGEPPPPPPPQGGLPRNSTWWYWDDGGDLGTAWRTQLGGSGWQSGRGALGYGESYLATLLGFGPDPSRVYTTTYFTTSFTVDDPAAVTSLIAEVMYDDGFVAYLNGVELGRGAMPAGAVTAATRGLDHEAGGTYEAFDWSAGRGHVVAGTNILAVEVHQAYWNSSDLVFDLSLAVR